MIDLQDQLFGMELEFTGITRKEAAAIISNHFGLSSSSIRIDSSTYNRHIIRTPDGREWTVMKDASLNTSRTNSDSRSEYYSNSSSDYSCEFVTPKCKYSDLNDIQEIVREFRHAGAKVNSSCGMHVHVDGSNHDVRSLINLSKMMWAREDILYRAIDFKTPRLQWCAKTSQAYIERLDSRKPTTKDELKYCWYGDYGDHSGHYDSSRYRALNLHAYFTKGTVEFRCFNSTLHAGEVKSYIQFALGCSSRSINMTRTTLEKKTESTNECYTFRMFLIKIPLNGDEYKTCRYHMLKHLQGDKAWKNREEAMRRRAERAQFIRDQMDTLSEETGQQLTPERIIAEPERENADLHMTARQQLIELLEEMENDTSITPDERTAIRLVLGFREGENAPSQAVTRSANQGQTNNQPSVQQWLNNTTNSSQDITPFTPNQSRRSR